MRKIALTIMMAVCGMQWIAAQQAPPASSPSTGAHSDTAEKPANLPQPNRPMTAKERSAALRAPDFSERVAQAALEEVLGGFQDHNPVRVMAAFDGNAFPGYATMDERVHSMMSTYESFRGFFHLERAWTDGGRNYATAEFDIEEIPPAGLTAPVRKNATLHVEFARTAKGWRIVALDPQGFFTR